MTTSPPLPDDESGVTAEWIRQALTAGGISDFPEIREVAFEDIGAGVGLVGKILRCHLTYYEDHSTAPDTVVVKLPSTHPQTFQAARQLRLYRREYDFYSKLATHIPLRAPAMLYGDFDDRTHRFVLVLEDLRHLATVDQLDGANAAQATAAIRAVARLHGQFWDRVDRPPVSGFHNSAEAERHALVRSVYQASLAAALDRFGHIFTSRMSRLAEVFGARLVEYLGAVASGPMTFAHGDFRLDNMFFGEDVQQDFAVVDWQVSGIASGLQDIAYFLSSSVPVAVRREIERAAVAEYHDIIAGMGAADFTFEECWRSYRQNMLGCFRTPIIAGGQLDFTGDRSRRLAEVFLQRTLTAIDDLDAGEFLPPPSAGP